MTHRSGGLLRRRNQQYFNQKRPVNLRVKGTGHLAELFPRAGLRGDVQDSERRGSVEEAWYT